MDSSSVLNIAVQEWDWEMVIHLINDITQLSSSERSWAVDKFIDAAEMGLLWTDFDAIVSHCTSEQLERLVITCASNGWWDQLATILNKGVSQVLHRSAIEEASKKADDDIFAVKIFPLCLEDQLEDILTNLVTRGLWTSAMKVLRRGRGVSEVKLKWVVKEASKNVNDDTFAFQILPLPLCCKDELDNILTHLVSRGLWMSVMKVVQIGVSHAQQRWAVEEASKRAEDLTFYTTILPHCTKDQLETVLSNLVTRGMWNSVGKVLTKGVSEAKLTWAVKEASKTADDETFALSIVHHCKEDQLETILKHLVTRGMVRSVDKVLTRGVSDVHQRWALEATSKTADLRLFMSSLLCRCSEDQMAAVLTQLKSRDLWTDEFDFNKLLPHFYKRQLESVLMFLVEQDMWKSVGEVLQKGVSRALHNWAVQEASQKADDWIFECFILKHCSQDNFDAVFSSLVARGLWQSVGGLLERSVSGTQLKLAVTEASKRASIKDFESCILNHCSEDLLISVLPTLESRGLLCKAESRAENQYWKGSLHRVISRAQKTASRAKLIYFLAKGADPFELNKDGETVLLCAVQSYCSQEMVTGCVRLGLSTHQLSLAGQVTEDTLLNIVRECQKQTRRLTYLALASSKSPFLSAVTKQMPIVANMLYESGACSYAELFLTYTLVTEDEHMQTSLVEGFIRTVQYLSPSLKEMATTPRSLMSTCRLVISHCLKVTARRHHDVQQLPLSDKMKNYIMFSDITDPDSSTYRYNDDDDDDDDTDNKDDDDDDSEKL